MTIFKRLNADACRIVFAEALSQFDGAMTGIIVADKSADETDYDVGRGSSRTYDRDVRRMRA
jgi:hypothetical protein